MKQWLIPGLVGLFAVTMPSGATAPSMAADKKEHVWLTDYAAARQLAQTTGKPLIVVFRCVP
jgi:hypothetical protein